MVNAVWVDPDVSGIETSLPGKTLLVSPLAYFLFVTDCFSLQTEDFFVGRSVTQKTLKTESMSCFLPGS